MRSGKMVSKYRMKNPRFVVFQGDFAVLQHLAEKAPQDGRQQLALEAFVVVVPFDVEKVDVPRLRPVLEHVHEQAVVGMVGHVVGDDVLQPAHGPVPQLPAKALPCPPAFPSSGLTALWSTTSYPWVLSAAGLEDGGGVEVGNPEAFQIGDDVTGRGEPEFRGELDAVRG